MGIVAETYPLYKFIYRYHFDHQLTEHELDHVFIGETSEKPVVNTDEVADWRWIHWEELKKEITERDDQYTFWFKQIINYLNENPLILPTHLRPKK